MWSEPARPRRASQEPRSPDEAFGIRGPAAKERARLHIAVMIGLIESAGPFIDARRLQDLRKECCQLLALIEGAES